MQQYLLSLYHPNFSTLLSLANFHFITLTCKLSLHNSHLQTLTQVFTFRGSPAREIIIANCGVIDEDGVVHDSLDVDQGKKDKERKVFNNHEV